MKPLLDFRKIPASSDALSPSINHFSVVDDFTGSPPPDKMSSELALVSSEECEVLRKSSINKNGFTIIETMLFLGISGMLIVGILIGTGTSINVQRYHDSVTSFRSFLQQQYSDVSNIRNESTINPCYGDGTQNNPRGQSDCVVLGRYITTTDSKAFSVKSVIGYIPASSASPKDDIEALIEYRIIISPSTSDSASYDLEWGSSIAKLNGDPMLFSMLILRSPVSGITRTFIDNNLSVSESNIGDLLTSSQSSLSQTITACIDSNGLFNGAKMAVRVNANTTRANGVETLGDGSGCL